MSYPYSQTNRLAEPHSYMYTQFQGEALLQSYQSSRMAVVCRCATFAHGGIEPDRMLVDHALAALEKLFDATSLESGKKFRTLLENVGEKRDRQDKAEDVRLDDLAEPLKRMTLTEPVPTLDLLHALIALQLSDDQDDSAKVWLDRLVQRYEVTKKIYEIYPAGFRKGEGANTSVRLYWLFALALSLFYVRSNEIKYLSTLLKLNDLLCSLPEDMLQGYVPECGLAGVLVAEIVSVQVLAEKKGVSCASK